MKKLHFTKQSISVAAVVVPLIALFVYVALRSGPLAPVSVVLTTIENKSLSPALFGIGTVEARYTYNIGPTFAARLKRLNVQVGDRVKAGQVLGEMDPVDLDERIRVQDAAIKRARAQLSEAQVRRNYAQKEAARYEQLFKVHAVSEELFAAKNQELLVTEAGLTAVREELSRVAAEREALAAQRSNLSLIAPVDGMIVSRNVDPGTTVVAGQAVVDMIDPKTLWVNVRFDQILARGLSADQQAKITLRSQSGQSRRGRILRVEPLADAVTEEILAKVVFSELPNPLPPIGELVEVTVELPKIESGPVVPVSAIHHINGKLGVWQVINNDLNFTQVAMGIADLDGHVQVTKGLKAGDKVVHYSENTLSKHSRIHVVEHIPGVPK